MKHFFIALVRLRVPVLQILLSLMPGLVLAQFETISTDYIFVGWLYTYQNVFLMFFFLFDLCYKIKIKSELYLKLHVLEQEQQ